MDTGLDVIGEQSNAQLLQAAGISIEDEEARACASDHEGRVQDG